MQRLRWTLFNLSFVAQTPKFGSRLLRDIASNWQFSGIYNYLSGAALNVIDGADVSLTGLNGGANASGGTDRPNVIGDWHLDNPTIAKWFNTGAFSKPCSATVQQPCQTPGTFGNSGRNTLRGPTNWVFDTGVARTFPIQERYKLDVRFEAFNLFNHARFNIPNLSTTAGTFGQITSARDPRILQVAMKISF